MRHPTIRDSLELMIEAHQGQVDKAGRDYWLHPVWVMVRLGRDATDIERHVALLHDIIEDSDYSAMDLYSMGYSKEIVEAVELLTKFDHRPYMDHIERIARSENKTAIKVKIADLQDNMDPERVEAMPPDERGLVERYQRALPVLVAATA